MMVSDSCLLKRQCLVQREYFSDKYKNQMDTNSPLYLLLNVSRKFETHIQTAKTHDTTQWYPIFDGEYQVKID